MQLTPYLGFDGTCAEAGVDECRRIFDALADGGRVTMPWQATFWSPGFGMLVDRYGIPWIVNSVGEQPG